MLAGELPLDFFALYRSLPPIQDLADPEIDICETQPADSASERGRQHVWPQARVSLQEVIPLPDRRPGHEREKEPNLETYENVENEPLAIEHHLATAQAGTRETSPTSSTGALARRAAETRQRVTFALPEAHERDP